MTLPAAAYSIGEDVAMRYSVEVADGEAALDGLEVDWNYLSDTAENPNAFMTHGWFRAWVKKFGQEYRRGCYLPHVLVLKEGQTVVGIIPLVRRTISRLFRVRKLEFSSIHADYNDLMLGQDSADQIEAAANYLVRTAKLWDIVDLRDLRDARGGTALIEGILARVGLPYCILPERDGCPYLTIDRDEFGLMRRLSGHARRTLRGRTERAVAAGLKLRIIEHPEEEPGLVKKLMVLDRQRNLNKRYAQFLGKYPEIFQALFDDLGPRGWLYVAMLDRGDEPIAFQLGFRCGDKLWDYTKAYDRSYSRFAPGTMIVKALLDYCLARGYHEYDFLRGEEPYKRVWSTGTHPRFRLLIWNRRKISKMRKFIYHDLRILLSRFLHTRLWRRLDCLRPHKS